MPHPVRTVVVAGLAKAFMSGALTAAAAAPPRQDVPGAVAAAATGRAHVTSSARVPGRGAVVVPSGSRITVAVRLGRPGRTAHLQVRTQRWTTLATARSGRAGRASMQIPTTATGRKRYRVLAPTHRSSVEVTQTVVVAVRAEPRPATPPREATEPSGQASGPQGPADAYAVFDTGRPGSIFRRDPCRPVRYRVHLGEAPAHLAAVVTRAVGRLSAATGLTFEDFGPTAYTGTAADPTQAGWPTDTDLLLTVAGERDVPQLAGAPVGYATLHRSTWSGADARIQRAEVVLERE